STVPVGTADHVRHIVLQNQKEKHQFDLVSNPEFLREGEAIHDFMNPDRIVIGTSSEKAKEIMTRLYKGLERTGKPIFITDIKSSEIIKYAANAFLATKISFMNQIAQLCEKVGGDVKEVAKGIGLDQRIGSRFLQAGVGYGGSCFPKDVQALVHTAEQAGIDFSILEAVHKVNEEQKQSLLPKIQKLVGDLHAKKIALLGLSFKPKTDDIRDAPSITIINQLLAAGAIVAAYDPIAIKAMKKQYPQIIYCEDAYETAKDASCLVVVTEWDEFRYLDLQKIKQLMKTPCIIDGRNMYDEEEARALGFQYIGVGRGNSGERQ
ncbi:MAG: UDP-glucose/GDP-mannose dehydrogenase family protein, partial [Nanoarchaeota archaeon]